VVPSTKPEKKYWTQPTMSSCGTSMVTFFFIMSLRSVEEEEEEGDNGWCEHGRKKIDPSYCAAVERVHHVHGVHHGVGQRVAGAAVLLLHDQHALLQRHTHGARSAQNHHVASSK
jgi:hypothetical protein